MLTAIAAIRAVLLTIRNLFWFNKTKTVLSYQCSLPSFNSELAWNPFTNPHWSSAAAKGSKICVWVCFSMLLQCCGPLKEEISTAHNTLSQEQSLLYRAAWVKVPVFLASIRFRTVSAVSVHINLAPFSTPMKVAACSRACASSQLWQINTETPFAKPCNMCPGW